MLFTSLPQALDHGSGIAGIVVAMVFIGIGVGGIKATVNAFIGMRSPVTYDVNLDLTVGFFFPLCSNRRSVLQYEISSNYDQEEGNCSYRPNVDTSIYLQCLLLVSFCFGLHVPCRCYYTNEFTG